MSDVKVPGLTTGGLLGTAFVVLKLTGVIDWSWWLVTLPFWAGLALVVSFVGLVALIALPAAIAQHRQRVRCGRR